MASDRHRSLAAQLLAAPADGGPADELLGATRAWVARVGPRGHVFFVGRHRALVALTDRRLVAWRHPQPGTAPSIDVPLSALRLRGEHSARPFFQVLVRVDTERGRETVVLEFRRRDAAFGRAVGRAIAGTVAPPATPPTTPPSAPPAAPAPTPV
jgi:hypothetical protein